MHTRGTSDPHYFQHVFVFAHIILTAAPGGTSLLIFLYTYHFDGGPGWYIITFFFSAHIKTLPRLT